MDLVRSRVRAPKTGVTTSFSATGGEDGDLENGITWPNPRFTDNGNGIVTDNLTTLIWLDNANCFGVKKWEQALADANTLADGSCSLTDSSSAGDWHLPNEEELHSLIHLGFNSPALSNAAGTAKWTDGDPFASVQSNNYWSSTAFVSETTLAWSVNLSFGDVNTNNKTFTGFVWPVRGGQ